MRQLWTGSQIYKIGCLSLVSYNTSVPVHLNLLFVNLITLYDFAEISNCIFQNYRRASRTKEGSLINSLIKDCAALDGLRTPCSQLSKVRTDTPKVSAN